MGWCGHVAGLAARRAGGCQRRPACRRDRRLADAARSAVRGCRAGNDGTGPSRRAARRTADALPMGDALRARCLRLGPRGRSARGRWPDRRWSSPEHLRADRLGGWTRHPRRARVGPDGSGRRARRRRRPTRERGPSDPPRPPAGGSVRPPRGRGPRRGRADRPGRGGRPAREHRSDRGGRWPAAARHHRRADAGGDWRPRARE